MELRWLPPTGPAGTGPRDALYVGGTEVARMVERVDGSWFARLHFPERLAVTRDCRTYESGRAGCETWARRHYAALHAHAELRRLRWLAGQTWRGAEALRARGRLAELEIQTSSPRIPAEARAVG